MPGVSLASWDASTELPHNPTTNGHSSHLIDKLLGRAKRPPGGGLTLFGGLVLGLGTLILGTARYWFFDLVPFASPSAVVPYYNFELVGDVFVASGALLLAFGWARLRLHARRSGWVVIPPSGGQLVDGAALAVLAGACVFGTFLFIAVLNWASATGGTFGDDLPGWLDPVALACWAAGAAIILGSIAAFVTQTSFKPGPR